MDLTIMIPTKDRPEFILRVLKYYDVAKFEGKILIGDSSGDENNNRITQYTKSFNKSLRVELYNNPELTADKMVSFLSKKVQTSYSLMHPDDDIVLVSSLPDCIDFLETNLDYSAVNGHAFNMGIDHNTYKAFGKVTSIKDYPLGVSYLDDGFERVENFFKGILNINMSVVRSKVNIDAFSAIDQLNNFDSTFVYGELIHASIVLSRGKVGSVEQSFLVRQKHPSQFYRSVQFNDWIKKSDPNGASNLLKNILISELKKHLNMNQALLSKKIENLVKRNQEEVSKNMAKRNNGAILLLLKKFIYSIKALSRKFVAKINSSNQLNLYLENEVHLELYFDTINDSSIKDNNGNY